MTIFACSAGVLLLEVIFDLFPTTIWYTSPKVRVILLCDCVAGTLIAWHSTKNVNKIAVHIGQSGIYVHRLWCLGFT